MTDALERVRAVLVERDATYPHPDYDKEPLDALQLDWADLRAIYAEVERLRAELSAMADAAARQVAALEQERQDLTAEVERLRGARSWERWAVVDEAGRPWVAVTDDAPRPRAQDYGERVIRVRITEISEEER